MHQRLSHSAGEYRRASIFFVNARVVNIRAGGRLEECEAEGWYFRFESRFDDGPHLRLPLGADVRWLTLMLSFER